MRITLSDISKAGVYYLASPYSDPDPLIREIRYLKTVHLATKLIQEGYTLLEPIAMSHHHAQRFGLPGSYEFWQERDRKFIQKCDGVIVLMLPGWRESVGVTDEIQYAKSIGKPVYYLNPYSLPLGCKAYMEDQPPEIEIENARFD